MQNENNSFRNQSLKRQIMKNTDHISLFCDLIKFLKEKDNRIPIRIQSWKLYNTIIDKKSWKRIWISFWQKLSTKDCCINSRCVCHQIMNENSTRFLANWKALYTLYTSHTCSLKEYVSLKLFNSFFLICDGILSNVNYENKWKY